jgi:hypothetical protein
MSSYTGALKGNSVLLAFVDLLILLLSFYMGIRLIKRTSMVTAVAFLFQLSILTAGTMALFSGTFLVPAFEIVIILLGFIIPFAFLVHDYISMKRRIKESGRAAPLIQRLEKENASPRYGEFAENVLDWGGAAGAGIISASLSIKDKTFKKQFMGQIRDANRLIGQGKFEEALTNYKILAGIACSNPAVVYNVAWLLRKRGEYEESVKWYKKPLICLKTPMSVTKQCSQKKRMLKMKQMKGAVRTLRVKACFSPWPILAAECAFMPLINMKWQLYISPMR